MISPKKVTPWKLAVQPSRYNAHRPEPESRHQRPEAADGFAHRSLCAQRIVLVLDAHYVVVAACLQDTN